MKVNRNSWHYRVWAYKRTSYRGLTPPNLCGYFWMVIAKIFIGIPIMAISPYLGVRMDYDNEMWIKHKYRFGAVMGAVWISLLYSYLILPVTWISEFVSSVTLWCCIMVLYTSLVSYLEERFPIFKKEIWRSKEKGDGFIKTAIAGAMSKKEKICPLIEVVD